MIDKNDIEQFYRKKVDVGVPHSFRIGNLFWHSGELININDKNIVLRQNHKFLCIALERIMEIRESVH
jgi:hypothetical protein